MCRLIVVAGPTASGKTAVAVELAKEIGGEVISADSMQVYRHMNIGTAKPTVEEMQGIPHHMIDILDPNEACSVALYAREALAIMQEVWSRGRVPILAGGTGFYINAVIFCVEFDNVDHDETHMLRAYYASMYTSIGPEHVHGLLAQVDAVSAAAVHRNNKQKVINALVFNLLTGKKYSLSNEAQKEKPLRFPTDFYYLAHPRARLYERIDMRTEHMYQEGLLEETFELYERGYGHAKSMYAIGYKEASMYHKGLLTRDEAIRLTAKNTRNYAKRQETWFKNQNHFAKIISASDRAANDIAAEILSPPNKTV